MLLRARALLCMRAMTQKLPLLCQQISKVRLTRTHAVRDAQDPCSSCALLPPLLASCVRVSPALAQYSPLVPLGASDSSRDMAAPLVNAELSLRPSAESTAPLAGGVVRCDGNVRVAAALVCMCLPTRCADARHDARCVCHRLIIVMYSVHECVSWLQHMRAWAPSPQLPRMFRRETS